MAAAYNSGNQGPGRVEVLLGRSLAICVHPYAAWRSRSAQQRATLVVAYFSVSYGIVLGLLHLAAF